MNTLGTIYKPPLKMPSTMSPGIISKCDGQGFPIYTQTPKTKHMRGKGIMSTLSKRACGVAGRMTKCAVGRVGSVARRAVSRSGGRLSALKTKVGASLKHRVTRAVNRRVGGTGRNLQSEINKKVNNLMAKPPPAVRREIRNELSREIAKSVPKGRHIRSSMNGGLSHNEVVQHAERAIYSGANL